MARAHLYKPIVTTAGDIVAPVAVRVLNPGGVELLTDEGGEPAVIYSGPTGPAAYTNGPPNYMSFTDGIVDFYLDRPRRVRLGVTPSGQNEFFLDDVDVLSDSMMAAPAPFRITNVPSATGQVVTATSGSTAEWADPAGGDGGGVDSGAGIVRWYASAQSPVPGLIADNIVLALQVEDPVDQAAISQDGSGVITCAPGLYSIEIASDASEQASGTPNAAYVQSADGQAVLAKYATTWFGTYICANSGHMLFREPTELTLRYAGNHDQIDTIALSIFRIRAFD